ncbi:negative regulation of amacrine cell differentiation [Pristimantis euphronides]
MMMMSLNSKQPFSMAHSSGGGGSSSLQNESKYSALHASSPHSSSSATSSPSITSVRTGSGGGSSGGGSTEAMRRACLPTPPTVMCAFYLTLQSNIFGGLDESLLARAEALAAVDLVSQCKNQHHHHHHTPHHSPFKPDATYHTMNTIPCTSASSSSSVPISHPSGVPGSHHHHHHHHHHHQPLEGELLDHITPGLTLGAMTGPDGSVVSTPAHPHMSSMNPMHQAALSMAHAHGLPSHMGCMSDVDADPRDLEAFAERFKQRRIKLGVTQADVGSALANLKIPGVGSLSQSTICRFESLTLSHNNMIALKPILQAWLEEAEKSHREKLTKPELFNGAEKKRKRTSIAAPEKRSLEAYFAIQPRPSSEKIAAIAEKLDLKKNVVRVWFCNQRQKQKRMKYSAGI